MRTKQPTLRRRRVQIDKNTASVPPIGAPSWCLNDEALRKFNRSDEDIPDYDYNTEDHNNSNIDSENDTPNDSENRVRKKKKKTKRKRKSKKSKK